MAHQVVLEEVFEECFPADGEEERQGVEPFEEDFQEALKHGPQDKLVPTVESKPKPIELKPELGKLGFEIQDRSLVAMENRVERAKVVVGRVVSLAGWEEGPGKRLRHLRRGRG